MNYFRYCKQLIRHIPIELSLGIAASLLLCAALALKVWYFGNSEIQPYIATWLSKRTAIMFGLLLALAILAVYKPLLDRRLFKLPGVGWLMFGSYLGLFWVLNSHIVTLVFSLADREWVAQVSLWYLQTDVRLGVYGYLADVVGFFVSQPVLYTVVAFSYKYTMQASMIALVVIALFSARLARQYLQSILLALMLSSVLWLTLPAVAPYQLTVSAGLKQSSLAAELRLNTTSVLDLYVLYPETEWSQTVAGYSEYWETVSVTFGYAVSSNPSTHVIWGVLLTVFLWRVHWLLGIIGLVFSAFEIIGTMLFLQHYLIDLPFGFLFAVLALYVTKVLSKFENRRLAVDASLWFLPILKLRQLVKKLQKYCH